MKISVCPARVADHQAERVKRQDEAVTIYEDLVHALPSAYASHL